MYSQHHHSLNIMFKWSPYITFRLALFFDPFYWWLLWIMLWGALCNLRKIDFFIYKCVWGVSNDLARTAFKFDSNWAIRFIWTSQRSFSLFRWDSSFFKTDAGALKWLSVRQRQSEIEKKSLSFNLCLNFNGNKYQ